MYTPALIVDGKFDAVGSDARTVDRILRQAAASQETAAPIDIQPGPAGLTISVGAGAGNATLLLIGYDRLHQTQVGRGENGGRTLVEANIIRSMSVLSAWSGALAFAHDATQAASVRLITLPGATHHAHLDRPEHGRARLLAEATAFLTNHRPAE